MPGMGIVISLADHRPERRGSAGGRAPSRDLRLRPRVPVDLPRGRARRPPVRRRQLAPGVRRRPPGPARRGRPVGPRTAVTRPSARPPSGVPASCACRWSGPTARPTAGRRCASPRSPPSRTAPRRSSSPPAGWPSAAAIDLDDPETLAEAAAAAGLGLDDTLAAAADLGRDGALEEAARRLLAQGADDLPVLQRRAHALRRRAPRRRGRRGGRSRTAARRQTLALVSAATMEA